MTITDLDQLQAKAEELEIVKKKLQHLLAQIGAADRCSAGVCARQILWVRHRNGCATPYDMDGTPHFITCVAREQFRKKRNALPA